MTMLLRTAFLMYSAFAVATACEDGTLEAVEGTRCSRYAECEGGTWYLKECESGQIFDSKTLKCASVKDVGIYRKKVSRCSEGRTYSHPGSRTMYYRCTNGRVLIQFCRVGEVFHPDSQQCQVDKEFQHPGLNRPKRNVEETCEEGSRRRNGKSCKDYLECVKGQELNRTCSDCMNFDDITKTCRFVFVSPCVVTPTPSPTTTTPQPDTTTHETKTEAPTTTPQPDTTTHETKTEAPTTTPQPDTTTHETKTEAPTTTPQPDTTTHETKTEAPTTTPQPDTTTHETKTEAPTTTPQPDTTTHETKTEAPTTTPQPDTTTHETKTEAPTTTPQPDTTTTESPTSTVAPCKDGDKIGIVDPNCVSYKECKHGVWVVGACSWSLKFDAIKKRCEYIWYNQITCAS